MISPLGFVAWSTLCPKRQWRRKSAAPPGALSRDACCRIVTGPKASESGRLREWQERARRVDGYRKPAVGQESMADDLGLLFQAVQPERLSRLQSIIVPTEGVAHQRQIEAPARLRLPDVRQLVDEEALAL